MKMQTDTRYFETLTSNLHTQLFCNLLRIYLALTIHDCLLFFGLSWHVTFTPTFPFFSQHAGVPFIFKPI